VSASVFRQEDGVAGKLKWTGQSLLTANTGTHIQTPLSSYRLSTGPTEASACDSAEQSVTPRSRPQKPRNRDEYPAGCHWQLWTMWRFDRKATKFDVAFENTLAELSSASVRVWRNLSVQPTRQRCCCRRRFRRRWWHNSDFQITLHAQSSTSYKVEALQVYIHLCPQTTTKYDYHLRVCGEFSQPYMERSLST